MKERPIVFSEQMVRAILDGRKTQMRRVLTSRQADRLGLHLVGISERLCPEVTTPVNPVFPPGMCPYGKLGDRLWVRENFAFCHDCEAAQLEMGPADQVFYRAGGTRLSTCGDDPHAPGRWRPAIRMPRWASRITLVVTDVRVERLHAITRRGVEAEGLCLDPDETISEVLHDFRVNWDILHARHPERQWAALPWVWRVCFEVVEPLARRAVEETKP